MSSHKAISFCTVFDCMDGRCQAGVGEWCRTNFGVEYPDTVTVAGCDGVLLSDQAEWERAMRMAHISAEAHGSKQAAVVGHSSCAGYQASPEEHKAAIKQAVERIAAAGLFETVVGLYDDLEAGTLEEVCRVGAASPASPAALA